jgi:hypothetical protein
MLSAISLSGGSIVKGRDVPELIKAHGVERALVMITEDLYGRQSQIKQAIIQISQNHDQMVKMIGTVMVVAERMKEETDRIRKVFGEGIPDDKVN